MVENRKIIAHHFKDKAHDFKTTCLVLVSILFLILMLFLKTIEAQYYITGIYNPGDLKSVKHQLKFVYIDVKKVSEPNVFQYATKIVNDSDRVIDNWAIEVNVTHKPPKEAVILDHMNVSGFGALRGPALQPGEAWTYTKTSPIDFTPRVIYTQYGEITKVARTLMFKLKVYSADGKSSSYNGNVAVDLKSQYQCQERGAEYLVVKQTSSEKKILKLVGVKTWSSPTEGHKNQKIWVAKLKNLTARGKEIRVIAKIRGKYGNWMTIKDTVINLDPKQMVDVRGNFDFVPRETSELQVTCQWSKHSNHRAWKKICLDEIF